MEPRLNYDKDAHKRFHNPRRGRNHALLEGKYDFLVIPLCQRSHWQLLCVHLAKQRCYHMCSLKGNRDSGILKRLVREFFAAYWELQYGALPSPAFDQWPWINLATPKQ